MLWGYLANVYSHKALSHTCILSLLIDHNYELCHAQTGRNVSPRAAGVPVFFKPISTYTLIQQKKEKKLLAFLFANFDMILLLSKWPEGVQGRLIHSPKSSSSILKKSSWTCEEFLFGGSLFCMCRALLASPLKSGQAETAPKLKSCFCMTELIKPSTHRSKEWSNTQIPQRVNNLIAMLSRIYN